MLTGKAKEDFEKWYPTNVEFYKHAQLSGFASHTPILFYAMPFSMQYGVYVDWFDEKLIHFYIEPLWLGRGSFRLWIYEGGLPMQHDIYPTRNEARQKAIEKANEIYNSK